MPEKFVVTFKPGKEMEERVREMERKAAEEAARLAAAAGEVVPDASAPGPPTGETYSPTNTYNPGT